MAVCLNSSPEFLSASPKTSPAAQARKGTRESCRDPPRVYREVWASAFAKGALSLRRSHAPPRSSPTPSTTSTMDQPVPRRGFIRARLDPRRSARHSCRSIHHCLPRRPCSSARCTSVSDLQHRVRPSPDRPETPSLRGLRLPFSFAPGGLAPSSGGCAPLPRPKDCGVDDSAGPWGCACHFAAWRQGGRGWRASPSNSPIIQSTCGFCWQVLPFSMYSARRSWWPSAEAGGLRSTHPAPWSRCGSTTTTAVHPNNRPRLQSRVSGCAACQVHGRAWDEGSRSSLPCAPTAPRKPSYDSGAFRNSCCDPAQRAGSGTRDAAWPAFDPRC